MDFGCVYMDDSVTVTVKVKG